MSAPIQPPGGGSGPPGGIGGPEGPGAADSPVRSDGTGPDGVDAPEPAEAPGVTAAAQAPTPVQEVAAEVRAGRLDPSEAVERLVQRALASPEASALSPALRIELETHLRATLADDPTLAALTRDLERGR